MYMDFTRINPLDCDSFRRCCGPYGCYILCVVLLAHGLHPEDCCSAHQGAPLFSTLHVPATADHHSEGKY